MTPTIVLVIGLRGAGKSTAAARIARRIGWGFIDLDEAVRALFDGKSVTEIFAERGEPAFREGEGVAIKRVLADAEQTVVALGGGTPTAPGAADAIRAAQAGGRAVTIYLRADPEAIAARLTRLGVGDRPRLIDGDMHEEMRLVFDERDGLYRGLADTEIDAAMPEADVRGAAERWLAERGITPRGGSGRG